MRHAVHVRVPISMVIKPANKGTPVCRHAMCGGWGLSVSVSQWAFRGGGLVHRLRMELCEEAYVYMLTGSPAFKYTDVDYRTRTAEARVKERR